MTTLRRRVAALNAHLVPSPMSSPPAAVESTAVFTAAERQQFESEGMVILRGAVPPEICDAVAAEMFAFVGQDSSSPASWYRERPVGARRFTTVSSCDNTMLNMWGTQAMWDLRTQERIHRGMSELWGTEKLWVSIDTCDLKPPKTIAQPEWVKPLQLHTDLPEELITAWKRGELEPAQLAPRIQGVVYLADTRENGGGFRCMPGFLPPLTDEWFASRDGAECDFETIESSTSFTARTVSANKGDMVIWNSYLPHGSGVNTAASPRMCQYVSMFPDPSCSGGSGTGGATCSATELRETSALWTDAEGNQKASTFGSADDPEEERRRRERMWRECLPQGSYTWPPLPPDDPRCAAELRPPEAAQLSPLGRRLLGIERWD